MLAKLANNSTLYVEFSAEQNRNPNYTKQKTPQFHPFYTVNKEVVQSL